MAKRRKKEVEYRDTFEFRLFPEYTYTAAQKKRLLLFQGRIEHWRAAVNYADSFKEQNRLNILYLIGYSDRISAYVEKTQSNLVVLCADVPPEFLKAYDAYWKLVKEYEGTGYTDQDSCFTPLYFAEREKENRYRGSGLLPDSIFDRNDMEAVVIGAYEKAKRDAGSLFSRYTVISRLLPVQCVRQEDMDKLVKKIYPYGREQAGIGKAAYAASAKRLREAAAAGLSRTDCSNLLGIQGRDSFEACKKGIRRCEMDLNVEIRRDGCVDLTKIMERMKQPPYGWSSEAHAAYSFGYALSGHLDGTYIFDGINCFEAKGAIETILLHTVQGRHYRKVCILVEETGAALSKRFAFLFDLGGGQYIPRDDTDRAILSLHLFGLSERKIAQSLQTISHIAVHKRLARMKQDGDAEVPACNMATLSCQKVEQMTRWPVSLIDRKLRDALCGDFDDELYVSVPIYGRQKVRDALEYFTWDRCKELKKKLLRINEIVPEMILRRYGSVADVEQISRICTTQCSGWCWDPEMFWEAVDRQVKSYYLRRIDMTETIEMYNGIKLTVRDMIDYYKNMDACTESERSKKEGSIESLQRLLWILSE